MFKIVSGGIAIWLFVVSCLYVFTGYNIFDTKNNVSGSQLAAGASYNPFQYKAPAYNRSYRNSVLKANDKRILPMSKQGVGIWVGHWNGMNASAYVKNEVKYANSQNKVPVFVVYAMPYTQCSHGVNGWNNAQYKYFINSVANGIRGSKAAVVLEPDSLSFLQECANGGRERVQLLQYASKTLSKAGAAVYLDAGHSNWHSASETARRIKMVGPTYLRGFALNVSNYQSDKKNIEFGTQVAKKTGLHFIFDSSRNGAGQPNEREYWCNGDGRIGRGFARGTGYLDARLWIKPPGESDGYCKGGPAAGVFWRNYAVKLLY